MDSLSLSQLNNIVKQTIELSLPELYWVEAELASIHENRGHCYMELIEKEGDRMILAQARACCWRNTWLRIGPKFELETGTKLHNGMKVLLLVKASFHEAYGFSWTVYDIDPTFTMGDMAKRRQEILRTLKEEGVIDLNKQLTISPFCKRIAVISSATAAGYGDFCNQMINNEYGFQFTTRLFPAAMQGEQVESSIINALNQIMKVNDSQSMSDGSEEYFDAVVIIRGGGSTSDLSGFDSLALAENIANFPLPVITGIGHDRDQSVLDIIACVSVKTPTAVAAFLIDNLANTYMKINDTAQHISNYVKSFMEYERNRIQQIEQRVNSGFTLRKIREENRLVELNNRMLHSIENKLLISNNHINELEANILHHSQRMVLIEKNKLMLIEQRTKAVDPINILKKGYSITLHDGVSVKSHEVLTSGDEITLLFAKGVVNAIVS